MLAEQVLHERAESTENAVTFARVLDGHDALTEDVARAQVEFAACLVAEINESLAGELTALDCGAVETVLVEPLAVILGLECATFQSFLVSFGAWVSHDGVELGRVRVQLLRVVQRHAERFRCVAWVTHHEATVNEESCLAGILRELDGLVGVLHALVDLFQDFGACAFKADAHFAATGLLHELEQIERYIGAGVAAPRNLETTFQNQVANLAHVFVACGKGIVFEEHFA